MSARAVTAFLATLVACRAEEKVPAATAALWIGGDVHLGVTGAGAEERLAGLAALTAGAVGVINLEGPVGEVEPVAELELRLANRAAGLAELRAAGVAVIGIANNHVDDAGDEGARRTAEAARAAGLLPVGDVAGAGTIAVAGVRIVVTAHDLGHGLPPGLADELVAARARGDILVAMFHVTGTPSYLPPAVLREAADVAIAAGARVVAAHGSHAIGPVERRGDAVIAWGLGNLLFSCDCTDETDGALLRIAIGGDAARTIGAAIVPIEAGLRGGAARPASQPQLIFELLGALRSSPLHVAGDRATF